MKILLILLTSIMLSGVVNAHSDEVEPNAFDRFFVQKKEGGGVSKEHIFELITYKIKSFFREERFAADSKILEKHLSKNLERAVDYSVEQKFRLTVWELQKYHSNLHLAEEFFIDSKNFENTLKENLILLNGIHSRSSATQSLVDNNVEIIIGMLAEGKELESLISISDLCDGLHSSPRFVCYKKVLEKVARREKNDILTFTESIEGKRDKGILSGAECHFIHHELGYSLHRFFGVKGIQKCPATYNQCTFGCHHGIAEEIYFRKYDIFEKGEVKEDEELKAVLGGEETYELFNLYHGFGHAFIAFHNLEEAQKRCDNVASNFARNRYCYAGIAHDVFEQASFFNMSFMEASTQCYAFEENKRDSCYYMLALVYTEKNFNKVLEGCKELDEKFCFVGIGASFNLWKNATNLQKVRSLCKNKDIDIPEKHLKNCFRGIITHALYYVPNVTRAYLTCSGLKNEQECIRELKDVYNTTHLASKRICQSIHPSLEGECLRKMELFVQ